MCQRMCMNVRVSPLRAFSKFSGDDGEGSDGAAGFQLQCGEEAVRCLSAAPALQSLAKAAPRFVGHAVGLHSIPQNFLPETRSSCTNQQLTLHRKREKEKD